MKKETPIFPEESLLQAGVYQYGLIDVSEIPFSPEVRTMCTTCPSYNHSWACPPAVGEVAECRRTCLSYEKMLVFSARYELEDSFDYEGMQAGMRAFKKVCDQVFQLAQQHTERRLLLSNEGCFRCKTCTWPHAPCRMPDRLFPSIEGYGILVSELAGKAGVSYVNGPNTVTYFGGLLFSPNVNSAQNIQL